MVRGGIETWALAAAGVLAAAALGAPFLGVAGWQPLAMGGAVALGLLYVTSRVLALEPVLDRAAAATRPPIIFLLLPFAFYLALIPWSIRERAPGGDEPWFLLVTHSIAYDFDLDLANNYRDRDSLTFMPQAIEPQPGDREAEDGAIYSRHGFLLQAVLAPAYRLAGRTGVLIVIAALAALAAWLFLDLTSFSRDARARLIVYLAFTFAAPLLIYSQQIWAEVPALLLAVAAFHWIARLTGAADGRVSGPEDADPGHRVDWRAGLLPALCLALLPALTLKLRFVLVSAALALIWVLRLRPEHRRRGVVLLTAVLAPTGALVLWSNHALAGTVLGMHSWSEFELYRQSAIHMALGLNGLFFDLAYGLIACAPIWLLLFPGAVAAFKSNRRLLFEVALVALPTLVLVASRREWYGGWSPPFRYALVVLPFLALLLVPLFERRFDPGRAVSGTEAGSVEPPAGIRTVALVLALLTGALAVLFVVEPGWTYNLADGRHHLVHHLEARTGLDFARFLPSATRARSATWLLPLLAIAAALLAVRVHRRTVAGVLAGVPILALAALPVLAGSVPTHTVEIESAAIHRSGGNQEPERWTMDRTRYKEAWVFPEGTRAEAAIVPGGDEVELTLAVRLVQNRTAPLTLIVRSGRREIGRLTFSESGTTDWHVRQLPAAPWIPGAPLILEVPYGPGDALPPNGVAIDRIDLRWN